jgi:hypothetical protein
LALVDRVHGPGLQVQVTLRGIDEVLPDRTDQVVPHLDRTFVILDRQPRPTEQIAGDEQAVVGMHDPQQTARPRIWVMHRVVQHPAVPSVIRQDVAFRATDDEVIPDEKAVGVAALAAGAAVAHTDSRVAVQEEIPFDPAIRPVVPQKDGASRFAGAPANPRENVLSDHPVPGTHHVDATDIVEFCRRIGILPRLIAAAFGSIVVEQTVLDSAIVDEPGLAVLVIRDSRTFHVPLPNVVADHVVDRDAIDPPIGIELDPVLPHVLHGKIGDRNIRTVADGDAFVVSTRRKVQDDASTVAARAAERDAVGRDLQRTRHAIEPIGDRNRAAGRNLLRSVEQLLSRLNAEHRTGRRRQRWGLGKPGLLRRVDPRAVWGCRLAGRLGSFEVREIAWLGRVRPQNRRRDFARRLPVNHHTNHLGVRHQGQVSPQDVAVAAETFLGVVLPPRLRIAGMDTVFADQSRHVPLAERRKRGKRSVPVGRPAIDDVGIEIDQRDFLVLGDSALHGDRLLYAFLEPVHRWDGAQDHDDALVQACADQSTEILLVRRDGPAANIVGTEHDHGHFRLQFVDPPIHVLQPPGGGLTAVVPPLATFPPVAVLLDGLLDQFPGVACFRRHDGIRCILQRSEIGHRVRDRIAQMHEDTAFAAGARVDRPHRLDPGWLVGRCRRCRENQGAHKTRDKRTANQVDHWLPPFPRDRLYSKHRRLQTRPYAWQRRPPPTLHNRAFSAEQRV